MPLTAARKLGWFDQKIMVRVCRVWVSENQPPSSIGNSLSSKNRIPSNNFGQHLIPQHEVSKRTSYQEQRSKKCNTSSKKKPPKSIAPVRKNARRYTCWNVTRRHACHMKRRYATFETSKSESHGHSPPHATCERRTVANGCKRLQTVANGCEHKSSVERTQIHPKTQLHADAEPRNAEPTMHTF